MFHLCLAFHCFVFAFLIMSKINIILNVTMLFVGLFQGTKLNTQSYLRCRSRFAVAVPTSLALFGFSWGSKPKGFISFYTNNVITFN